MKITRAQAEANREAILASASRLFREHGIAGISIADIAGDAGLTHGGVYGQFASKDALADEACRNAFSRALARHFPESADSDVMLAYVRSYLTPRHRDDPGRGCVMAALGTDAARDGTALRRAFTEGVRGFIDAFTRAAGARTSRREARKQAAATLATLVGGLVLARATADDPRLSDELLAGARAHLEALWTSASSAAAGGR